MKLKIGNDQNQVGNNESLGVAEELEMLDWQKTLKKVLFLVLLDARYESLRRESFNLVQLVFRGGIKKNFPKRFSALESAENEITLSEKVNILMKLMSFKISIVDILMKNNFDEKIVERFSQMDNDVFYDQFVAPLVVLYLQDK